MSFPETLTIVPLKAPPRATVRVPGSKSMTNRALVLATYLGWGNGAVIVGAQQSEDTEIMAQCLETLGFDVIKKGRGLDFSLKVTLGAEWDFLKGRGADLYVGNSGTTARFLTALVCAGKGRFRIDGDVRMRQRPIEDLLIALRQLGVDARSELGNGCPPVIIEANGLPGGRIRVMGDISSQFLSALLLAAPMAKEKVIVDVDGPLVSWPYVSMSVELMKRLWLEVMVKPGPTFEVLPIRHRAMQLHIEPDATSASYFFAAAAITGGEVTVADLNTKSIQGDIRFVDLLEEMGCRVVRAETGITVSPHPEREGEGLRGGRHSSPRPGGEGLGGSALRGIDADMNDISDAVPTLAAVACFAEDSTTIRNVAHIRHKESDRLSALATELRRIGAGVEELSDGLIITPAPLHGAEIETYGDHRIAMAMALIGLRVPGIVIKKPGCVAKTYPGFFDDLERLRQADVTSSAAAASGRAE